MSTSSSGGSGSSASPDLATPAGTARALREFGLRPRKGWGQHFLVSRRALTAILTAAAVQPHETVLEIGAGLGTLTVELARRAAAVTAVEIDAGLLPALRSALAEYGNVAIIHGDVMRLDLHAALAGASKVVANLPYAVASPLIVRLLERPAAVRVMVLTVQREVADRLAARPGGKEYGALSVAVQYRADVATAGRIPATAFYPPPDVESTIIRLDVLARPKVVVADDAAFFRVVKAAFAQRRKTLRNTLAAGLAITAAEAERACAAAGLDPRRRGETLSLEEFAALTAAFER
ncbi:MAG TPA: 16S rRNA (adenine(1518)-N(6)/adenine(1519)-N(6))-dimethyltransferase RsmA [bacterium]|nr:16S rRNA (adenine(1518)-N(6)/adenine(1519)-N(6))-dimethyltransferase RsmA [bacterium]